MMEKFYLLLNANTVIIPMPNITEMLYNKIVR